MLNGTSTNNLAHDVSVKLTAATYKLGKIATATDQTHTATVVGYLPGHRAAALIVAKSLGLGAGSRLSRRIRAARPSPARRARPARPR